MAYGNAYATVEETANGREITIKIEVPKKGEPSKSGNSDNLTNPNAWLDVVDEFGEPTEMQVRLSVVVPYRRAAEFRWRRPEDNHTR